MTIVSCKSCGRTRHWAKRLSTLPLSSCPCGGGYEVAVRVRGVLYRRADTILRTGSVGPTADVGGVYGMVRRREPKPGARPLVDKLNGLGVP